MIVSEDIKVSKQDGLVRIQHRKLMHDDVDMGGDFWVAPDALGWLRDAIRECLDVYGFSGTQLQQGDEDLDVYWSGHEQAPEVSIANEHGGAHAGTYVLSISFAVAEDLVKQIDAL